jgi:TetR/AcrR family transcriptional regulator, macrolide resistance operon repressor
MARKKLISDDEVLDAALPVMVREGPSDLTLAKLGAGIGISPATLIQRFGDKKTLILRVFERDNARFAEWLAEQPRGRGIESVLQLYQSAIGIVGEQESLADHLLWLREDLRDPKLNKMTRRRFRLWRRAVVERLPTLSIPADVAARLLDAQWHGALVQWGISPKGRLADYVMESLRMWFKACGSPAKRRKL